MEEINIAQKRIEDLRFSIEYHTKQLVVEKGELTLWEGRVKKLVEAEDERFAKLVAEAEDRDASELDN